MRWFVNREDLEAAFHDGQYEGRFYVEVTIADPKEGARMARAVQDRWDAGLRFRACDAYVGGTSPYSCPIYCTRCGIAHRYHEQKG